MRPRPPRARALPPAIALALALAGCPAPPGGGVAAPPAGPGARPATPRPAATALAEAPALPTRALPDDGAAAVLRGEARVLTGRDGAVSNKAAGIVGKIRTEGAGIIGKIRGEAGIMGKIRGEAEIIGKIRFWLAQVGLASESPLADAVSARGSNGPPIESRLADAVIEIFDTAGRQLVDAGGVPVTAMTDAAGAYRLEARLPAEPLVLVVRLADDVAGGAGGELAALAVPAPTGEQEVRLDTASTLGAAFVAARLVPGRPGALARLPAAEAQALARDAEAARAFLPAGRLGYGTEEMAAAAEGLRAKAPAFDATIKRIAALLLAGQADLGAGLPATHVALTTPASVLGDGQGGLWIGEQLPGRVRRARAGDGEAPMTLVVGEDAPPGAVDALARATDGALWIGDGRRHRVWRLAADGRAVAVLGEDPARPVDRPIALAPMADGGMLVGESPHEDAKLGRLFRVTPEGTVVPLPGPPPAPGRDQPAWSGLVERPDGTIVGADRSGDRLMARAPDGAWTTFAADHHPGDRGRLALGPGGALYGAEEERHRIWRYAPDGTRVAVAGTGKPGHTPDGERAEGRPIDRPTGLWAAPDGTLYFVEAGDGVVRAIAPDGTLRTVAGARAGDQAGRAAGLALNGPTAMAVDGAGRLLVAEAFSGTLKRLAGDRLEPVAGSARGFAGDGGPAAAARFEAIMGVAIAHEAGGEAIYVADQENHKIRRIGPDGVVTTVVSKAWDDQLDGRRVYPAMQAPLSKPYGLAVGPDGRVYFTDALRHVVWRLNADATIEVIAGSTEGLPGFGGDGGPAAEARLTIPTGLAVDAQNTLYVLDAGGVRVRAIDLADPARPITAIAGIGIAATLQHAADATALPREDGAPALAVGLYAPIALALGPEGALYVGETGSTHLAGALGELSRGLEALPPVPATVWRIDMRAPGRPARRVAGPGSAMLAGTGGDEALGLPAGLAIDPEGRLVIADGVRNQLRRIPREALVP